VDADEGYEYLLGMRLWSLTEERVTKLAEQGLAKQLDLERLDGTSAEQLWLADLEAFAVAWESHAAELALSESHSAKGEKAVAKRRTGRVKIAAATSAGLEEA